MKINDLLKEIEDILDSAGGFPLTGKVIVDPDEISDILKEIKNELPEEIQQAQWIKNQQQQIIDDAHAEYNKLVNTAKEKADQLVDSDDITLRAKKRADDIMRATEENVMRLKKGSYEYINELFASFQKRMNDLNANYAQKMYEEMSTMFQKIDVTIEQNRSEINALAAKLNAGESMEMPVMESMEMPVVEEAPVEAPVLTEESEPSEEA